MQLTFRILSPTEWPLTPCLGSQVKTGVITLPAPAPVVFWMRKPT